MNGTHHTFERWGVYSCYRYSGMGTIIHFIKLDRVASTFLLLSEKDKALSMATFKELPRKTPLTSLLRELLKMNLHNIAFFFFFCSNSSRIRRAVSTKGDGFHFRLLSHIRGMCTDAEMAIICGGIVRRLKFLKIVSDAGDTPLCKAQDCWPTCFSVSFFLRILLKQAKAFRDHNLADSWLEGVLRLLSWKMLNVNLQRRALECQQL